MKLCFINICLRPDTIRRLPPVGLAYILTAAQKAGYDFDLIDMDINQMTMQELEAELVRGQYDAVGFGCIVTGFRQVQEISALIRKISPRAVIFAGNSVATSIPELLLRNTEVDVAVMGEGDITVVELLHALRAGTGLEAVAGLCFMKDGALHRTPARPLISDLDSVGHPNWSLFDLEKYDRFANVNSNAFGDAQTVKSFPVNTARGCPYNCTFCYHVFKGQKYRRYSDAKIIEEIVRLHKNMGTNHASLWDELSFPTPKSIEGFLAALRGMDFPIGWEASCRAGLLQKHHLPLVREMKALGCDNLSFSLESADPAILAAMDKRMEVSQFIEQAEVLQEGGVIPLTSIIFGFPQETEQSIAKTLDVCRQCNIYPSVGFLLPLPGTPIYDWAVKSGHIANELEYLLRIGDRQDFHINLTSLPDDALIGLVTDGLQQLAKEQGLKLDSVLKTGTYKSPLAAAPKNAGD